LALISGTWKTRRKNMLLHDLIFARAKDIPEHSALLRGNESIDYATLADNVRYTAGGIVSLGIKPGDRVGVYLNKRIEAVLSYFGASCAGAVFVPINPSLKPAQVTHILRDCDVRLLVTSKAQAVSLEDALGECPAIRAVVTIDEPDDYQGQSGGIERKSWAELIASGHSFDTPVRRIESDIAAILYTSGSTGKPKGVVLTQRNMVAGALSIASYVKNTSDDIMLAVLPFSFDAGFSQLSQGFSMGSTVVLIDYLLPRDVLKAAARHQVTGLAGVPPLWNQLVQLDWPEDVTTRMRFITNTGGAMPTATLAKLRERLPGTRIILQYGLTEAFRATYLPPEELDRRPTSIGKAIPNAEVMVVRDDGTTCEPGEPGELVQRGALVSLGYWNDPERTAARFKPTPGQHAALPLKEIAVWSGDTVVKDADGFMYFVGRRDDMIKSSGYRISPTEVEEVIYGTGLVSECAALGIPHPELGQAVVIACFSDAPGDETRDGLLKACKNALPNYMVPTMIVFRNALPRNPNGKIDRKALSDELQDIFDGQVPA
jgi:acyl-CoA ligase (AMP-forming) (exosortase A-associated)